MERLFLLDCSTLSNICSIYDGVFVGIHWFLVISWEEVILVNRRKDVILVKGIVTSNKTQENNYFLRFFTLK